MTVSSGLLKPDIDMSTLPNGTRTKLPVERPLPIF